MIYTDDFNGSRKKISLFGATGSVGKSVLDVVRSHPEKFQVVALSARSSVSKMAELCMEFKPEIVCLFDAASATRLKISLGDPLVPIILYGRAGLEEMADMDNVDHVSFCSSGAESVWPILKAVKRRREISVANKESIIIAGKWLMASARFHHVEIKPVDSEHNAIWQCLKGEPRNAVESIVLTASGGPFLNCSKDDLYNVKPEDALKHPVWAMGSKITIDSATLMNKGLEILEARHLFDLPVSKISVLVHPGSLVHGMVRFVDGVVKALLSRPDMRIPAASALGAGVRFDDRMSLSLDWPMLGGMTFLQPDIERFPCLAIARECGVREGFAPSALVGSDEVAVEAFLSRKIGFMDIPRVVERVISSFNGADPVSIEESLDIYQWSKKQAVKALEGINV